MLNAHFGFPVTQQESVRNQCALAVNKRTKRLLAYTHTHTHTGAAKPGSPASGISQLPRCSGPFVSVSHCPLASIYVGGRMETCCFVLFKEACPFRLMPHPCSFFYFLFVLFQERTCWFICCQFTSNLSWGGGGGGGGKKKGRGESV